MTELEQLLKQELEKEKQYSQKLESELNNREQAYLSSLKKIEQAYIIKLEELCKIETQEEQEESDIDKRLIKLTEDLKNLEMIFQKDTESLINNQKILSNQLINLEKLLQELE